MTENDKKFLNQLYSKRRVYNEMGKTLTQLSHKLKNKEPLYAISTRVIFKNKGTCSFNMGEMGLSTDKCVEAYEKYINILVETLKEDYVENNLKINAMESKVDVKENM